MRLGQNKASFRKLLDRDKNIKSEALNSALNSKSSYSPTKISQIREVGGKYPSVSGAEKSHIVAQSRESSNELLLNYKRN